MSSAPIAATIKTHRVFSMEKYFIWRISEQKNQANGRDRIISNIPIPARNHEPTINLKYANTNEKLKIALRESHKSISMITSNISTPIK